MVLSNFDFLIDLIDVVLVKNIYITYCQKNKIKSL